MSHNFETRLYEGVMKVFLGWSEDRSRLAAVAFKSWIEEVLQCVEPWMSPDIEKGANWPAELSSRLDTTYVGVVFLTQDNLASPWLHFEVGALAKTKIGRACVVLLDVAPLDVKGPLSLYQHTMCTEDDMLRLVQNLRTWAESENERVISTHALEVVFKRSWPALERSLEAIRRSGKTTGPIRTGDDLARETLAVVRTLRDEVVSLRTALSSAGTMPPTSASCSTVETLFRIRQDLAPQQIEEMVATSALSFPHLRLTRQNDLLLVSADGDQRSREEWAAWRKRYGTMIFAAGERPQ
jgi:hypothetical protein